MIFQTLYNKGYPGLIICDEDINKASLESVLKYAPQKPYSIKTSDYPMVDHFSHLQLASDYLPRNYSRITPEEKADYLVQALLCMTGARMFYVTNNQLDIDTLGVAWPLEKIAVIKNTPPVLENGSKKRAIQQIQIHELLHILHPLKTEKEIREMTRTLLPFESSLPQGFN